MNILRLNKLDSDDISKIISLFNRKIILGGYVLCIWQKLKYQNIYFQNVRMESIILQASKRVNVIYFNIF